MKRSTARSVLSALFLVFCLPQIALAEHFETIINNSAPENRVDIAILGDGYTAAEMQKYNDDVQALMQAFFLQSPFREYKSFFNVHRIDVISNESGADHPERIPAVFKDTALAATYNCAGTQRLICVNTSAVNSILGNTLTSSQYDLTFVIVNDPEYGGSGGSIAVASTHPDVVELVLHELGHSFGLLADEYGGPPPPFCNNSLLLLTRPRLRNVRSSSGTIGSSSTHRYRQQLLSTACRGYMRARLIVMLVCTGPRSIPKCAF